MEADPFIKIIVVGEQSVGKTCLLNQFCYQKFDANSPPTIGCDFTTKVTSMSGKTVRLQLWDIAGQEKYNSVSKLYVRGALGCVIVSDISNYNTLLESLKWKQIVEQNCENEAGIPIMLVQNKLDLVEGQNLEEFQTLNNLKDFAKKENFFGCMQASAKEGVGLKEIFQKLIQEIMDRGLIKSQASNFSKPNAQSQPIKLSNAPQSNNSSQSKGSCC